MKRLINLKSANSLTKMTLKSHKIMMLNLSRRNRAMSNKIKKKLDGALNIKKQALLYNLTELLILMKRRFDSIIQSFNVRYAHNFQRIQSNVHLASITSAHDVSPSS